MAIQAVAGEWPTYGYRRVTAQSRREGWTVNRRRVRRLMGDMGLQVKAKCKTQSDQGIQYAATVSGQRLEAVSRNRRARDQCVRSSDYPI
ncbi:MAG: IS3 family transposase [Anaerolineae bacterium]